jgi:hypothetical protein
MGQASITLWQPECLQAWPPVGAEGSLLQMGAPGAHFGELGSMDRGLVYVRLDRRKSWERIQSRPFLLPPIHLQDRGQK